MVKTPVNKTKAIKKATKHTRTFVERQQESDRNYAASLTNNNTPIEPIVVNENVVDDYVVDAVMEEEDDAPMQQFVRFFNQKKT
jgi:hypothetical protein